MASKKSATAKPGIPLKDRLTGFLPSAKVGKRRLIYTASLKRLLALGEREPLRVGEKYRRKRALDRAARGPGDGAPVEEPDGSARLRL